MVPETFHHTILCYDLQESAKLENPAKLHMRQVMRESLQAALQITSISAESVNVLDTGDGAIVLLNATVSKQRVLDTWLGAFHERIQRNYERSSVRCQLRLSIHAGEVHIGPEDQLAPDLDFAARLVNAPIAKRTLETTPSAGLAVIVSDAFYHQVVRQAGPAVSAGFTEVAVQVKETDTSAWLHLPGWARVPLPPPPPPPPAAETAAPAAQGAGGPDRVSVTGGTVGVIGSTTVTGPFTVNGSRGGAR